MRGHQLLASHVGGLGRAPAAERRVAEVAAECEVEDEPHVPEVARRAHLSEAKEGVRPWPSAWIRLASDDVHGLLPLWPEPSSDVAGERIPLRRVSATAVLVEGRPHGALRARLAAPLVAVLARGAHVAIRRLAVDPHLPAAGEVVVVHDVLLVATHAGVQGRRHTVVQVHALDDVVLAPRGPWMLRVLPEQPHRRPCAAPRRHVGEGHDEQALAPRGLALDADGLPAPASSSLGHVRPDAHHAALLADELQAPGHLLVDVLDLSMGRVCVAEEGEAVEEKTVDHMLRAAVGLDGTAGAELALRRVGLALA
mmetsp:Transcript_71369/g.200142  ORF Transcript_71369/g.200142 Transcript_71369/m.200142 type:complete len:311 (+) Transcript_71369:471-1403(+)